MAVDVVHVWRVRMTVDERFVPVRVDVRFARWIVWAVRVLVVLVMHMGMRMCHSLVCMDMFMMFGQMHPNADTHQCTREH